MTLLTLIVEVVDVSFYNQSFIKKRADKYGHLFPSSPDSRKAFQLLAIEWALSTGKLSAEGFPRNSVVKYFTILT